jgi:hypothetical protein
MKTTAIALAAMGLFASAPAFAAPVSASFQNLGKVQMTVSTVNTCGSFLPKPAAVLAGQTSPVSSTDCGTTASAAHVTYYMGSKRCIFHISTIYTIPSPLLGTPGYWTPKASADSSGGATCNVVSQDLSKIGTGAFKAVFSMK